MSTTTSEDGVLSTQPQANEAVNEGSEQAIAQDENGTPSSAPVTSEDNQEQPEASDALGEAVEQIANEDAGESTQAEDIKVWAEKKGLPLDDPIKLAEMYRNAERKMHEATSTQGVSPKPPEVPDMSEDPAINQLIERQHTNELRMYVRDWFDANPDMKQHRGDLMRIAQERPYLTDLDDVAAHLLANPQRYEQAQKDGGRKALENLAQKQAAVPPRAGASNPQAYQSNQITPKTVYDLVEKNDQAWFEKNYDAITKAMQG